MPLAKLAGLLAIIAVEMSWCQETEIVSRDVQFTNDEITFHGIVTEPKTPGSYPGIVLVGGSGPSTAMELQAMAEFFAHQGLVALAYDKRGSGTSGGSWTKSSLSDLVSDVLEAIKFVRHQPSVDSTQVGLWSISQGGWVAGAAAPRCHELSFAIVVTGGGATPRAVEEYGYRNRMRHGGISDSMQVVAMKLIRQYFDYLETGQGRSELEKAMADAKTQSWYASIGIERVLPSDEFRAKWSWVPTYNPRDDIQHITIPVLVLLGGRDILTPWRETESGWRESLTLARNPNFVIKTFPDAGHGITVGDHKNRTYAPDYFETMRAWLATVTKK